MSACKANPEGIYNILTDIIAQRDRIHSICIHFGAFILFHCMAYRIEINYIYNLYSLFEAAVLFLQFCKILYKNARHPLLSKFLFLSA